eukprot:SAG31_NODE_22959_length_514_cov_0.975904_1_plen_154_part_10
MADFARGMEIGVGAGFSVIHNGLDISGGDTTSNGMKETGLQKDRFNLSDYHSNTNPITASLSSGGAECHYQTSAQSGGNHHSDQRGSASTAALTSGWAEIHNQTSTGSSGTHQAAGRSVDQNNFLELLRSSAFTGVENRSTFSSSRNVNKGSFL